MNSRCENKSMMSVDLHPLLKFCFLGNTQFIPPNWHFLFYLVSLTVSDTDASNECHSDGNPYINSVMHFCRFQLGCISEHARGSNKFCCSAGTRWLHFLDGRDHRQRKPNGFSRNAPYFKVQQQSKSPRHLAICDTNVKSPASHEAAFTGEKKVVTSGVDDCSVIRSRK